MRYDVWVGETCDLLGHQLSNGGAWAEDVDVHGAIGVWGEVDGGVVGVSAVTEAMKDDGGCVEFVTIIDGEGHGSEGR